MSNIRAHAEFPEMPLWGYTPAEGPWIAITPRSTFESRLCGSALRQPAFKAELVAQPKAVVERELGHKLPSDLIIHVLEESSTDLYLVIPSFPFGTTVDLPSGVSLEEIARFVFQERRHGPFDGACSNALIIRAWGDLDFQQSLVKNPKAAINEVCDVEIPDGVRLNVLVETAHDIYIVLPFIGTQSEIDVPPEVWTEANTAPMFLEVMQSGCATTALCPVCTFNPLTNCPVIPITNPCTCTIFTKAR